MVVCAFDVVGLCTVLVGCGEFVYILAGAGGCGALVEYLKFLLGGSRASEKHLLS
jgi:hypothetical protein